jgi:hypothetical protein
VAVLGRAPELKQAHGGVATTLASSNETACSHSSARSLSASLGLHAVKDALVAAVESACLCSFSTDTRRCWRELS